MVSEITDEEYNNFMVKVNEISGIVKNLTSKDKKLNELGTLQANEYLKSSGDYQSVILDKNNTVVTKTKFNRTFINKHALLEDDNPAQMSADQFKRSVEVDADRRSRERLRNKERSDTFKKRANTAFRRGEYEQALSLYNEALSHIRDNCVLYTNRALTYINLELYDQAIEDCKMALKLDPDSLKAWLYMIKCYLYTKDKLYEEAVKQVKSRHPTQMEYIDDYVLEVKKNAGWLAERGSKMSAFPFEPTMSMTMSQFDAKKSSIREEKEE